MGEIADYFRRERYITRRFSLLILGGTAILVPLTLASGYRRIPAWALEWAFAAVAALVAVAVVFVIRGARARFPRTEAADDLVLDGTTRKMLRNRIRMLEWFVVFYAAILVYGLLQARKGAWPGLIAGAVVNLLMQAALIKAIRRLKAKLKQATGDAPAGSVRSSPGIE